MRKVNASLQGGSVLIAGWGLPSSCSGGLSSPGNIGDVQGPGRPQEPRRGEQAP